MPPDDADRALEALRRGIDELDEQIVGLLARRMELSRRIGAAKRAEQGPDAAILAPAREAELLERLAGLAPGLRPDHLRAIYREVLSASRAVQRPPRIAFLGPRATFGHQAALERFGAAAEYVPAATNPDVVSEVERCTADFGVLPIENLT